MIIQLDLHLIPDAWLDDQYVIVEDHWEDGEEWAVIEILHRDVQSWIRLNMRDCIVEDAV